MKIVVLMLCLSIGAIPAPPGIQDQAPPRQLELSELNAILLASGEPDAQCYFWFDKGTPRCSPDTCPIDCPVERVKLQSGGTRYVCGDCPKKGNHTSQSTVLYVPEQGEHAYVFTSQEAFKEFLESS